MDEITMIAKDQTAEKSSGYLAVEGSSGLEEPSGDGVIAPSLTRDADGYVAPSPIHDNDGYVADKPRPGLTSPSQLPHPPLAADGYVTDRSMWSTAQEQDRNKHSRALDQDGFVSAPLLHNRLYPQC